MDNPFRPAKTLDLRQVVYEKIKAAIVSGHLAPGEKLSEVDLASKLAVSRTPVREAIRQLVKTGLVTLTPRKGAYVTCPTAEDAEQLYALRDDLERFAVQLVARRTPRGELEKFRAQFAGMNDSTTKDEYLQADYLFHQFLYESSGNRFLQEVLSDLVDQINLYRPYSLIDQRTILELAQEHIQVIDALLNGDGDRASRAMGDHIRHNSEALESALTRA